MKKILLICSAMLSSSCNMFTSTHITIIKVNEKAAKVVKHQDITANSNHPLANKIRELMIENGDLKERLK